MGAKPYPAYKDSGVEWIGDIPEHWEVVSAKRLCKQVRTRAMADDQQLSATQKYGVIPQSLYSQLENSKLVAALAGTESFIHVEIDNYVISLRSFQGGLERCMYSGCVSPAYTVLELSTNFAADFFQYLAKSMHFISALQSVAVGIREGKTIGYEQLVILLLPVPPLEEQKQIASFLDRETSKIDILIEKQQQLINLLKEKRGSLISHTVTKGLNPNVPMKDSGVEWIGEIPEHWEVKRLKDVAEVSYGVSQITEYVEQGIPILRATNVRSGKFTSVGLVFIRPSDVVARMISLNDGDIIVVRSGATTGDSAIVTPELVGAIAGFDIVVRSKTIASKFCQYLFLSSYVRKFQWDSSSTRAAQPHLNSHELNGTILTSPPLEEQKQISAFLDRETSKIDTLIDKANESIALLKERRSSLISAVVTGKIDVRGVA